MEVHIYLRGRKWWARWSQDRNQKRTPLNTSNEKKAKQKAQELEARLTLFGFSLPEKILIEDIRPAFESEIWSHNSKQTARSDIGRLKLFLEANPVKYLHDITPPIVSKFLKSLLEKGRQKRTANKYRLILYTLFEYARREYNYVSQNLAYPNPIKLVRRYREPKPVIIYLNQKDILSQLGLLEDEPGMQSSVATMIFASLRRGEIIWLTQEDVQLDTTKELPSIGV